MKSAGDPLAATPPNPIMLRFAAILFVFLAGDAGLCGSTAAAQTVPTATIQTGNNTRQPAPHSNSADGASSGEDSAAENELLAAANKSRAFAGAPPLRADEGLREAAVAHARLMIEHARLDHQFPSEAGLLQRIALVSPLKMDRAGENIAYANCAPDVNTALMRSPPHRENLLDRRFNIAGIAAIWSHGQLYVVQDFAHEVPSYSPRQSAQLVGRAVDVIRQQAGLPELSQLAAPNLDEAACSLANDNRPNAHLLATAYENRKIITYTESRPELLPVAAATMLRDPGVRQFAVGSCYARNAHYPTGMYWVAILLY